MKTVAARDAKNGFGRLLDAAAKEPVTIEKNGRAVAVVVSYEDYRRLEALENAYWVARAEAAGKEGFIGPEDSDKLLKELLSAEG